MSGPEKICEARGHNYQHVVTTFFASGTGETADRVFLYCTCCADTIEIDHNHDEN